MAEMIDTQIRARGIRSPAVLEAMRRVERASFVPPEERGAAYADGPQAIGHGQTISQPFIVALMSEALDAQPGDRVLEIGAGSGYQTAILLEMGATVFGIERVHALTATAAGRLDHLGYRGARLITADGSTGWPLPAGRPLFDRIMVAAAAPSVPEPLLAQLAPGGRMVIPAGGREVQELLLVTRDRRGHLHSTSIESVRFVPLVGREGFRE